MATPLQAIPTPAYAPDTFDQIATLAARLEALGVPRFATGTDRDTAITTPAQGQCCAVAGALQIFDGTAWKPVTGGTTLDRTVQANLASASAATDTGGNITPGVTGILPIANGGTNATTAAAALTNLGAASTAQMTAASTQIQALMGAGGNLILNGAAIVGSNFNFSAFTFNPADAPIGTAGSFVDGTVQASHTVDNLIGVDINRSYTMSMWCRDTGPNGSSCIYLGLAPLDSDRKQIMPYHWKIWSSLATQTTLAAPLNPKDTVVHLSDASAWTGTGLYVAVWNYVDDFGRAWGFGDYTRNTQAVSSISGNDVTLTSPWAQQAAPAGAIVTPTSNAANYMYALNNQRVTGAWQWFQQATPFSGPVPNSSTSQPASNFPRATAFVKPIILGNYAGTNPQTAYAGVAMYMP